MTLHPGSTPVPGYRLIRLLGQGGFAEVWEAARPNGERFALKFLECRQRSAAQVAAEVRMLRAISALEHPHIIPLYEAHASERHVVLVLELAEGSLEDLTTAYQQAEGRYVPDDIALELLRHAAIALDFLATMSVPGTLGSRGLQHCDIKPSNLLLVGNTLKVADFGLCSGTGWQTHKNGCRGTPPYAPPELYRGSSAPGTDQFSLAVTWCAIVMGERPFHPAALSGLPSTDPPIDFTKLRTSEYPVIARALHPYPSSRWPSCVAFVDALASVLRQGRKSSVRLPSRTRKSGTFRVAGVPRQRPKNTK